MNAQKITQQFSINEIINQPIDIEQYDEFIDEYTICNTQTDTQYLGRRDNQILQIQNHLRTIKINLLEFRELVYSMNSQNFNKPVQINNVQKQERPNEEIKKYEILCKSIQINNLKDRPDELVKAYACKLKCLKKIKQQFNQENYLDQLQKENDQMKQSIVQLRKQYCFASSNQLRNYARAFKPPMEGNFMYVNLYHDKISGEIPYLKLIKVDSNLVIQKEEIKLINDAQFIIDLKGPNKRWISISYETDCIQEKMIYDYLVKNNALKKQILDFTLEFKFLNEQELQQEQEQQNSKICNLLLGKFLHEIIIKRNGSLENYFQFVKQFILENQKYELMDQQRYLNLLNHLQHPEIIQGIGK